MVDTVPLLSLKAFASNSLDDEESASGRGRPAEEHNSEPLDGLECPTDYWWGEFGSIAVDVEGLPTLVASRERDIEEAEERLGSWTERLRRREAELVERERRILPVPRPIGETGVAGRKVGRNERCPCGSGLKYKRCHGA